MVGAEKDKKREDKVWVTEYPLPLLLLLLLLCNYNYSDRERESFWYSASGRER